MGELLQSEALYSKRGNCFSAENENFEAKRQLLELASTNIQVRQAVAITNKKIPEISECNMKVY
jgi:hypothetical protein